MHYGGKILKKTIMVKTNAEENKQFYLTVKGKVLDIAKVSPPSLTLKGKPGQTLEGEVTVAPEKGYGFSIESLTQKYGRRIKASLVAPKAGDTVWKVRVKAESDKVQDLYDVITLKTDSPYKPKIEIRVFAMYADNSGPKS